MIGDHPVAEPVRLAPQPLPGTVRRESAGWSPFPHGTWYAADDAGAQLTYTFPQGTLAAAYYLAGDMLLHGNELAVFELTLHETGEGRTFTLRFGALNQCQVRIRIPLAATSLAIWRLEREGGWLKPMVRGQRVDRARVDRMDFTLIRTGAGTTRWCLTPLSATLDEPPRLAEPQLPAGPLLDELGQSTLRDWPGRSSTADEVVHRLRAQLADASSQQWPEGFSRWGGWAADSHARLTGTGFFRTHHDGVRWWLVDPDGHRYWSAGLDDVTATVHTSYRGLSSALTWLPEQDGPFAAAHDAERDRVDYLVANLIRAFGADGWHAAWGEIALGLLRRGGFTTIGNWSDIDLARAAQFPYVRPLELRSGRAPMVFRDFPDVFAPEFESDAADHATALGSTRDDPALVGYFLMNEPTWGFASESPAEGMLHTSQTCATRRALRDHLAQRYGDDARLRAAWGRDASLERVAEGRWIEPFGDTARRDLEEFSTIMIRRLFDALSAACRAVDPNHLNLGARYYTVPPDWALAGMTSFDVFSINCYPERVLDGPLRDLSTRLHRPVIIGEWHFGALDVGLPATGIGRVADQEARGRAFRVYAEDAAAKPWCVGVHYFTLYDQSALGRFDGENYNIGFVDVCHRPYQPLVDAARASHARLYRVAQGELPPYDESPEHLPRLFI